MKLSAIDQLVICENLKLQVRLVGPFPFLQQKDAHFANSLQDHQFHALLQNLLFLLKNQDHEPAEIQPKNKPIKQEFHKCNKGTLSVNFTRKTNQSKAHQKLKLFKAESCTSTRLNNLINESCH